MLHAVLGTYERGVTPEIVGSNPTFFPTVASSLENRSLTVGIVVAAVGGYKKILGLYVDPPRLQRSQPSDG